MDTWEGIPTRGVPGTKPVSGNIPHIQNSAWYGDADGNADGLGPLQINSMPGPDFPEPPANLRSPWYFSNTFNPANTNTPDYVKVVMPIGGDPATGKPGWTQNPSEAAAKYVTGFDANGDPLFGSAPTTGAEAAALAMIRTGAAILTALGK
jgi:hypothetical protein